MAKQKQAAPTEILDSPLEFRGVHAEILEDKTGELEIEGARMSAKTWTISEKVRRSCIKNPGIWWLICRYSGAETDNQLRPTFINICRKAGTVPEWDGDESAYHFPAVKGKVSKVFAYGLKTQSKDQRYAKIRGSGVAGVWIDQTEEVPEDIATEIRAFLRQPGFQHQLIFSPNPPPEDHYLTDQFPEDEDIPGRKLYRLSIYDNKHNITDDTIEKLERTFPPTHAKHRTLILGRRGVNVTGRPVYEGSFLRALHVVPIPFNPELPLIECIHAGQHHPSWLAAQRTYYGGLNILGGIMGKRLFLHEFLPVVTKYRRDWFPNAIVQTCTDPPPTFAAENMPFTTIATIRAAKLEPVWTLNGTGADVREAVIQNLAGMMQRRYGTQQFFQINSDPSKWLMASQVVIKHSKFFVDGIESAYVWDDNLVSVGHKKFRQPKVDEWVDGAQRCLENIDLNFCSTSLTDRTGSTVPQFRPASAWT